MADQWWVYMLRCSDNSLYCGISNDVDRRVREHKNGSGSKYVRSRLPAELVYGDGPMTHSAALKREAQIKRLSKPDKERLVQGL